MPSSIDNESEILLGNKQLLAVFAVVAILLAIAFTGGYMLGKSSGEKKAAQTLESSTTPADAAGPITRRLTPDDAAQTASKPAEPTPAPAEPARIDPPRAEPIAAPAAAPANDEPVLGKHSDGPKHGQSFVQVAAVAHKEAQAAADVLRQHGFQAHIAPAPNTTDMYRVLVGPGKDAADLRNTEDALRKLGYTKCFVQHY